MAYNVKVILDSIAPNGKRLTTLEVEIPRIVLAELRTHRVQLQDDAAEVMFGGTDEAGRSLSLNSASSRAIPVKKMLERVISEPFVPDRFPINQSGMQAQEYYVPGMTEYKRAKQIWLKARDNAIVSVKELIGDIPVADTEDKLNVHKQIANRLLESWMWHTVIISATEWSNFLSLRCDAAAQEEIRTIAIKIKALLQYHKPTMRPVGGWHMPFIQTDEFTLPLEDQKRLSVARSARVSYLSHNGTREVEKDYELYDRLLTMGHMSPFEHVASAMGEGEGYVDSGCFKGWRQLRKDLPNENR